MPLLPHQLFLGSARNDGQTFFCEVDNGFKGITFLGDNSYQCFFVGSKFRIGNDPNRVIFWVDDLRIEWRLVASEAFHTDIQSPNKQALNSYFNFEINYINNLKHKEQVQVNDLKLFEPISIKGERGEQTFQIMRAILGKKGDRASQYWVATIHPLGVVLLSVIQTKKDDGQSVNRFIDSYMNSFSGVDAELCKKRSGSNNPNRSSQIDAFHLVYMQAHSYAPIAWRVSEP